MTDPRAPICFTCSQPILDPPRFQLMPSGEFCPACRDRVLDAAPSLLPRTPAIQAAAASEGEPEVEVSEEVASSAADEDLHDEPPGDWPPDPPLSA